MMAASHPNIEKPVCKYEEYHEKKKQKKLNVHIFHKELIFMALDIKWPTAHTEHYRRALVIHVEA
jgi:hypothetical protein